MKSLIRFGRKIPIPSTVQVRHELRALVDDDNARQLCAESEGLASTSSWDEICASRAQTAQPDARLGEPEVLVPLVTR